MAERSARPVFLIAGGRAAGRRRGADALLAEAVKAGGVDRPLVACVGAASGDNAKAALRTAGMLMRAGAGRVVPAPLSGRRADPAAARAALRAADIVFFGGGDVEAGMEALRRARIGFFLRALFRAGKPFLGVSAGSIMLSRAWVRWRDPRVDSSAELFPCLGLARVLCDTHGEADGWEELRALLALSPSGSTGYGIVSGSALVVAPGGRVEARGGEVHRFQKRAAEVVQLESLLPV